jgi:peroxiredoxin
MSTKSFQITPRFSAWLVALSQSALLVLGGAGRLAAAETIPATPLTIPKPAAANQSKPATLQAGAVAPDFVSMDLSGRTVRLSDLEGKVVVLDFWATWCGPCQQSLPHTQEVAKKFKKQGVVVLAVCTSDTRAKFEAWMKVSQVKYPDIQFTCDPNDRGSATYAQRASQKDYGVAGIPTQFIIGRDGKISSVLVGYSAGDTRLESALAKVGLSGPGATPANTKK